MGRSKRQRINLKVLLDTRNVFLNLAGQDRIEQQWSFGVIASGVIAMENVRVPKL